MAAVIAALVGEMQVSDVALILAGLFAFIAVLLWQSGAALRDAPQQVDVWTAERRAFDACMAERVDVECPACDGVGNVRADGWAPLCGLCGGCGTINARTALQP